LGGEVVWLIRSRTFRGGFWSRIKKRTDSEYYAEARAAFYRKDYKEFLRLAEFINEKYSGSGVFEKMVNVAGRYLRTGGRTHKRSI
jgi:hypothetical protein